MNILCPFCFQDFDKESLEFVCQNDHCFDTKIVSVKDDDGNNTGETKEEKLYNQKYFKYSNKQIITNHIYRPRTKGFWMFKEQIKTCDKCGSNGFYVCPCCNNILPTKMAECGSEIISVIGSPGSGKTNYIISLIQQLRKYGCKVGLNIRPQDKLILKEKKATDARYSEMESILFGDKPAPLDKTPENSDNNMNPWIFALDAQNGKTIYIVFYDSAGENFVKSENIIKNAKYLNRSVAILLLLDTWKIKHVKKIIETKGLTDTSIGNRGQDFDVVFDYLFNYLEANNGKGPESVYKKPIALVLSKFDIVKDNQELFDAKLSCFENNSSFIKTKKFDIDEIDNCSQQIKSYLVDVCDEEKVISQIYTETRWSEENAKFFGVSALGQNPIKGNKLTSEVKPYRVMDPIIWILSRIGGFGI